MEHLIDPTYLTEQTEKMVSSLSEAKPDENFVEFASATFYDRLDANILRYRVYGPYWWALKDVLRRQDYDVGSEDNADLASTYKGATDAETLVAAELFYKDNGNQVTVDNTRWTLDKRKDDYILYDSDMEERRSITDSSFAEF